MADTSPLKSVEKEMISIFCQKYQIESLRLSAKKRQYIFNGMEPDLIGGRPDLGVLYIGEITTSGYFGQRGRDFHVGAARKVCEAFSKFYLFHDDADGIIDRIKKYTKWSDITTIKCFFIVPEGSRFINALGYRERLFGKGYMDLEIIKLSEDAKEKMTKVLEDSKNENKHKR